MRTIYKYLALAPNGEYYEEGDTYGLDSLFTTSNIEEATLYDTKQSPSYNYGEKPSYGVVFEPVSFIKVEIKYSLIQTFHVEKEK